VGEGQSFHRRNETERFGPLGADCQVAGYRGAPSPSISGVLLHTYTVRSTLATASSWEPGLALIMIMDVPISLLHQSSGDLAGNREGRRALSMRCGCFDLLATQVYTLNIQCSSRFGSFDEKGRKTKEPLRDSNSRFEI
jgi:hypothetical protein